MLEATFASEVLKKELDQEEDVHRAIEKLIDRKDLDLTGIEKGTFYRLRFWDESTLIVFVSASGVRLVVE